MPCELATIYRDVEEISKEWENNITRLNYLECKYFEGKKYTYFLYKNILYKCEKEFSKTTLKLLEIFRKNFVKEIEFNKHELSDLLSMVIPKVKNSIKKIKRMKSYKII